MLQRTAVVMPITFISGEVLNHDAHIAQQVSNVLPERDEMGHYEGGLVTASTPQGGK